MRPEFAFALHITHNSLTGSYSAICHDQLSVANSYSGWGRYRSNEVSLIQCCFKKHSLQFTGSFPRTHGSKIHFEICSDPAKPKLAGRIFVGGSIAKGSSVKANTQSIDGFELPYSLLGFLGLKIHS